MFRFILINMIPGRSSACAAISICLIAIVVAITAGCGSSGSAVGMERDATATPRAVETPSAPTITAIPTATHEPIDPITLAVEEPTPTIHDPFVAPATEPDDDDVDDAGDGGEPQDVRFIGVDAFQERVSEIVGEIDGELEIVVSLRDGFVLCERDSTEPMEAASLYKLAIMVELFRQRETQELSFDDAVVMLPDYFLEEEGVYDFDWIGSSADLGSLVTSMIAFSSNVAAAALLARLGPDAINQTMDDIGLYETRIRWDPGIWVPAGTGVGAPADLPGDGAHRLASVGDTGDQVDATAATLRAEQALNVTTAADVAALYVMLLNGEVVSPEASEEMLDLLSRQVVNDRLPRYLPEGTVVAHKTGNWDGLVHDAGVIWSPVGPVIVVVMSDIYDEGRAVELIASIALEAYLLEY